MHLVKGKYISIITLLLLGTKVFPSSIRTIDTVIFPLAVHSNNSVEMADHGAIMKVFPLIHAGKTVRTKHIRKKPKKYINLIFHINGMSNTHYLNQRFRAAKLGYDNAKHICEQGYPGAIGFNKTLFAYGYLKTLLSEAIYFHAKGDLGQARTLLLKAEEIIKGNQLNKKAEASFHNNMALLYHDLGDYEKAYNNYQAALTLTKTQESRSDSTLASLIGSNYSLFLYVNGQKAKAKELIDHSIVLASNSFIYQSLDLEKLLTNKALMLKEEGQLNEAFALLDSCAKQIESKVGKRNSAYANTLINLAAVNVALNKNIVALYQLDKAAILYKKTFGANHLSYAESLIHIARLYEKMKYYKPVKYLYQVILDSKRNKLGTAHRSYTATLFDLAETEWKMGELEKASAHYNEVCNNYLRIVDEQFQAMTSEEQEKFWFQIKPAFDSYFSFIVSNSTDSSEKLITLYNRYTQIKGLLFNSTNDIRNAIYSTGDSLVIENYKAWKIKRERQVYLYSIESTDRETLENLENDLATLEKSFSGIVDLKSFRNENNFEKITQHLQPHEVAVEVLRVEKTDGNTTKPIYIALIIEPGATEPVITSKYFEKGEDAIYNFYKNCIVYRVNDTLSYHHYWKWLGAGLKNYQTIYFSSDGIYNKVNLNTLKRSNGDFLFDEVKLIPISNTNKIPNLSSRENIVLESVKLFGSPNFGDQGLIAPLPGTEKEVNTVESILLEESVNTEKFLNDEACEDRVKNLKNPTVLHLATHGFFLEDQAMVKNKSIGARLHQNIGNPLLQSGLYLCGAENADTVSRWKNGVSSDGILTAYETINLDLSGTDLVVLSACETGRGKVRNGEGVYGLQRAFQVAGAKSVIMSLWKVNDQTTQELMTNFYKYWVSMGDREAAFTRSVKEIKKKYEDPYYWGAFVLITE